MPSVIDSWKRTGVSPQVSNAGVAAWKNAGVPTPFAGLATVGVPLGGQSNQAQAQAGQAEGNWWDTAMRQALSGAGDAVEWAERNTTQALSDYVDQTDNPVANALLTLAWAPGRAVGATVPKIVDTALVIENIASRTLSSASQAGTWDNPLYRDGVQLSDFFKMVEASEHLTPGQAITNNVGSYFRGAGALMDQIPGIDAKPTSPGDQGNILSPGFDIYANEQALKDNNFWNLGTGAVDAAWQVAAGKGVGAAVGAAGRVSGIKMLGMTARDIGKVRTAADEHAAAVLADEGGNWVGKQIENIVDSGDVSAIRENPLVRNSIRRDMLSGILAETHDYDLVKEIVLADHGDRLAMANLAKTAPDHLWAMGDMNTQLAREIAERGGVAVFDEKTTAVLNKTYDAAVARDGYYKRIMDAFLEKGEDGLYTEMPVGNRTLPMGLDYTSSRIGAKVAASRPARAVQEKVGETQARVGEMRAGNAVGRAVDNPRFTYRVLGAIGDSRPVTVLAKWTIPGGGVAGGARQFVAGRRALNMVTISGMRQNDVMEEALAYMSSRPIRGNRTVTMLRPTGEGGFHPVEIGMADYRNEILNRLGKVVGDEKATWEVLQQMEKEVLSAVAYKRGVPLGEVTDALIAGTRENRDIVMQGMKDNGFFFDASGNRVLLDPTFRSQLSSSNILTDIDAFDKQITRTGRGDTTPGRKIAANVGYTAERAFDLGQTMFRTATLFRPAYTVKNSVAEPMLASWLAHGTILAEGGLRQTSRYFLANRRRQVLGAALKTGDKLGLTKFSRVQKELDGLHQNRLELEDIYEQHQARLRHADSLSPTARAREYEVVQREVQTVEAQIRQLERLLDERDPGWHEIDAMPTLRQIDKSRKIYRRGVEDPQAYGDRLLRNAQALRTRADHALEKGTLPPHKIADDEGVTYRVKRWERTSKGVTYRGTDIVAEHPKYGEIGNMSLKPHPDGGWEIHDVSALFRREGIGTGMWQFAKKSGLDVKHSAERTDMGDAWARKMGDDLPPRDPNSPVGRPPDEPKVREPRYTLDAMEKAAKLRAKADRLDAHGTRWKELTDDEVAVLAKATDDLDDLLADLSAALDNPLPETKALRDSAKTAIESIKATLRPKHDATARGVQRRTRADRRDLSARDDVTVRIDGEEVRTSGVAPDDRYGDAVLADVSAGHTQHMTADPSQAVGVAKSRIARSGNVAPVRPGAEGYYDEYRHAVNRLIRDDALARQILDGRSIDEIEDWLLTPAGREYRDKMRWADDDVDVNPNGLTDFEVSKIDEAFTVVDSYLPTEALRATARERVVDMGDLAAVPFDLLPTITGGALQVSNSGMIRRAMDGIWKYLATVPEDRIGRMPFIQREYARTLQQNIDLIEQQGGKVTVDSLNALKYAARRQALDETEKTFYTIRRYNNLIYASRYLTVYPAATVNSFSRFGRLAAMHPDRAFIATTMWGSMFKNFGVDEDGKPVDNMSDARRIVIDGVPEPIAKAIGADKFSLNADSLQVIGGRVSPNWTITLPTSVFVRSRPDMAVKVREMMGETVFNEAFPYGFPTQGDFDVAGIPMDTLTPTWVKDFVSAVNPSSTRQAGYAIDQFKWDMAQWMKVKESGADPGPAPTIEAARDKAEAYTLLLAAIRFVAPGSPNFVGRGKEEMDLLGDLYRQELELSNGDAEIARAEMFRKNGEWITPMLEGETSYLFFAPATADAFTRIQQDGDVLTDLIANNPKTPDIAAVMFGDIPNGFDVEVANWMSRNEINGEPIRGRKTPEDVAADIAASQSWKEYDQSIATRDALMAQFGYTSLRVKDAAWLNDQWKAYIAEFEADPKNAAWLNERTVAPGKPTAVVNTMRSLLGNEKFMRDKKDDPYWSTMATYLEEREVALAELAKYDKTEDKDDIKAQWDTYVRTVLAPQSSGFISIYNRFLDEGKDLG